MTKYIRILAALLVIVLLSQIQFADVCEKTKDSVNVYRSSQTGTEQNNARSAAKAEEMRTAESAGITLCPEPAVTAKTITETEPSSTPEASATPEPSVAPELIVTTVPTANVESEQQRPTNRTEDNHEKSNDGRRFRHR